MNEVAPAVVHALTRRTSAAPTGACLHEDVYNHLCFHQSVRCLSARRPVISSTSIERRRSQLLSLSELSLKYIKQWPSWFKAVIACRAASSRADSQADCAMRHCYTSICKMQRTLLAERFALSRRCQKLTNQGHFSMLLYAPESNMDSFDLDST